MKEQEILYKRILDHNPDLSEVVSDALSEDGIYETDKVTSIMVWGPVTCAYVLWVLRSAVSSGKKRLYFLARDGYIMYHVAQVLCEAYKIQVECRYLRCSRYALRLPCYHRIGDEAFRQICTGGIQVTFGTLMHRAGLSEEEGYEISARLSIPIEYNRELSYREIRELEAVLRSCESFRLLLKRHSKEAYKDTAGYLRQEGLLEGVPYAIVDSGWVGSIQYTLAVLLSGLGKTGKWAAEQLDGYYFGLYETPKNTEKKKYHTFYFGATQGFWRKVYFNNCLFEAVFSSPEGMTKRYRYDNERYEAVFERADNFNKDEIERCDEYITAFTRSLIGKCETEEKVAGCLKITILKKLLKKSMIFPSREEADYYGRFCFSDDTSDNERELLAPVLSGEELRQNTLIRRGIRMIQRRGTFRQSAWLEGSIVRYGKAKCFYRSSVLLYKVLLYLKKYIRERKKREKR